MDVFLYKPITALAMFVYRRQQHYLNIRILFYHTPVQLSFTEAGICNIAMSNSLQRDRYNRIICISYLLIGRMVLPSTPQLKTY